MNVMEPVGDVLDRFAGLYVNGHTVVIVEDVVVLPEREVEEE